MTRTLGFQAGVVLVLGILSMEVLAESPSSTTPARPSESAGRMTLPPGFKATLFASEPEVRQPIAFNTDARGRLWVAENFSYPNWLQPASEKDRIVIFEDVDGDGKSDRRTVFWDQGRNVTGVALGFGGVYVAATPYLLFIPDRDGDDVPDGPAEVVLDGWDVKAQHNLFNALTWGPDGWLYGCNGILSNSRVGVPGAADDQRVAINCGVWRYHPSKKLFEAVAHGTTNPWGLDFDDYGEMFITNCVIPHLFHVVPGARFTRMFGEDLSPHSYQLIPTCADHIHWSTAEAWSDIRTRGVTSTTDRAGGGHAHTGAMIYLGDNWPDEYRNSLFTCNIHGRRVNHDSLELKGSSYVAHHEKDFLLANDTWFRGMELRYGPDGGVFLTDWSDVGECHEMDGDLAHRENGRIYKVTYGDVKLNRVNLDALDDLELVKLQGRKNDWFVRNSRRILQERAASGRDLTVAHRALLKMFGEAKEPTKQLRALWALHVTNGLNTETLLGCLKHPSEHVRGWAVRLLAEGKNPSAAALAAFEKMAREDPSPRVRLALASGLQRFPKESRWGVARGLLGHPEDAGDAYLPLMAWYGVEPLVEADRARAVALLAGCRLPVVREFLARRAVQAPGGGELLVRLLGETEDNSVKHDVLAGMAEAIRGRKREAAPEGWAQAFEKLRGSNHANVRKPAILLALFYGDPRASTLLRETMKSKSAGAEDRREALAALVGKRVDGLAVELQDLLDDPVLRAQSLRALAAYDDPSTPAKILAHYKSLTASDRDDAVNTLAARPAFAKALLEAVGDGTVAPREISVTTARQMLALGDPAIAARLEAVWGAIRPTSKAKASLAAKYKSMITPEAIKSASRASGREVFKRSCASCHKLFDEGGDVGPELTGSDRANLDYLLENVLDPSATVGRDFKLNTIATQDGRLISGIIRAQNERTIVVQTVNERLNIDREDIEAVKPSDASMMPEGLFENLTAAEVRNLVAYLGSSSQVAATANSEAKP